MSIGKWVAVASLALAVTQISAQEKYPTRPVTIIVPQAAAGANDTVARIIGQKLTEQLGQPFIVENRAGAGGNIGTAFAAKAAPDGYTLLLTVSSAHVINPALYRSVGFDPVKDFVPVATLFAAGYVLVANRTLAPNTVKELIDAATAKPGEMMFASAGNGTLNHLIGEMLQNRAGIKLTHVQYNGAAPAVQDVVGGQVSTSVQSLPSSLAFIRSGRLNVLAVTNEKRVAALPNVPMVGETIKGFGATPWYALLAPAKAPPRWSHDYRQPLRRFWPARIFAASVPTQAVKSLPVRGNNSRHASATNCPDGRRS